MEEMLSDQQLVRAALDNLEAFAGIVDRYKHRLTRYIRHLGCRDNQGAEDILQEVFIKVYRNLNDYDETLAFSSWIYRIAHNETISFFRKNRNVPQALDFDTEIEALQAVSTEDPSFLFDRKSKAEYVHNAIEQLDARHKEVVILRYLESKSYAEIADILQKPPGTVAILLRRAKLELKKILVSHYD